MSPAPAILILALMSADNLDLTVLGTGGLPSVLEQAAGPTLAKIILLDVAFAIFICTMAIQTASIRIAFSMARDHALPFADAMAHVDERRRAPVAPALLSGVLAIGVLVVNLGNPSVFLVVTSVSVVIVYLAYLLVTAPVLLRRLSGWPHDGADTGLFSLGRPVGLVVNAVAVVYGVTMAVNLVWPRSLIYGEGYAWGGVLFVVGVVALGAVYFMLVKRHHEEQVVAEHRADTRPGSAAGGHDRALVGE